MWAVEPHGLLWWWLFLNTRRKVSEQPLLKQGAKQWDRHTWHALVFWKTKSKGKSISNLSSGCLACYRRNCLFSLLIQSVKGYPVKHGWHYKHQGQCNKIFYYHSGPWTLSEMPADIVICKFRKNRSAEVGYLFVVPAVTVSLSVQRWSTHRGVRTCTSPRVIVFQVLKQATKLPVILHSTNTRIQNVLSASFCSLCIASKPPVEEAAV